MLAAKERIKNVQAEIEAFKVTQGMEQQDELLPETYFKLKHPGDEQAQANEL